MNKRLQIVAQMSHRRTWHSEFYYIAAPVGAAEQRLKGFQYRSIGGLGQQTQQTALALEQAAQDTRDRKCPMAAWNGSEYFSGKFLGKERGAFGLAAGAEIPCAAGERQKMLLPAFPSFL